MDVLLLILAGVSGLLFGMFVGLSISNISRKFDGLFIVDDSDEETTKWILDVSIDPKSIPDRKEIHLKVRKMNERDV